jgi:hypothetical protein
MTSCTLLGSTEIPSLEIVTQEFHTIQPEFTFREFGIEFVISQLLQDNTKMLRMLGFALGINENIIDEDHYELIQFIHED